MTRRTRTDSSDPPDWAMPLYQGLTRVEERQIASRQLNDQHFAWLEEKVTRIDRRLEQGDGRMASIEKDARVLGARLGKVERRPCGAGQGTGTEPTGTAHILTLILALLRHLPWAQLGQWAAVSTGGFLVGWMRWQPPGWLMSLLQHP